MSFNMIRLDLDFGALYQWGHSLRLGGDAGYLVHAALRKLFGEMGAQPFLIQNENKSVLGYTDASEEQLRACLENASDLENSTLLQALRLSDICCKAMPTHWISGVEYHYSVFCRPVARNAQIEGDVWLLETHREYIDAIDNHVFSGTLQEYRRQNERRREDIYKAWFQRQFAANEKAGIAQAACLKSISIDGYRCNALTARGNAGHVGAPQKGNNRNMPEMSLSGMLRVVDPQAFSRLVRRGVGRHRAFGYGMMLLRPGV